MSELKSRKFFEVVPTSKAGFYQPGAFVDGYLKSEADKVIATLTDKANYYERAYKNKSEELADTCRFYQDELRHQKYKRCLAMAKWCMDAECKTEKDADFLVRWEHRWLALAEKFKEAK